MKKKRWNDRVRDMMSTLRWKLMEEYSEIEKRENVDLRSFEKERIKIIEECVHYLLRIIFMYFHIIALKVKFSMRRKNSHVDIAEQLRI